MEAPKIIADALAAGFRPHLLFYSPQRIDAEQSRLVQRAERLGARVVPVSDEVLGLVTETVTPQGIVAIFPYPSREFRHPSRESVLFLVIDRLQDPGNLGTLLRSALGSGTHAVFLLPGTVDPYNGKVVRAAAGAHFHLPIVEVADELPPWVRHADQFVVADPRAAMTYDDVDWTRPSVLAIGSEAHGVSPAVRQLATHVVAIPLRGGVESLNAAVAGSIILFEAARQRRKATGVTTILR
ncbi:MAG: RNA methyltransferase [Thermomicrobium sp.]|nr:RNA methyltransferase [Thermomicrobium sp.]